MNCPACGNMLTQKDLEGIEVDVCENGCGGIWLDNFEFEKFDESHEAKGESLLDIPRSEHAQVDYAAKRHCPKCGDVVMSKHFVSVKREVEIDECPGCGGIWLDAGELRQIRDQFGTEDERKAAAALLFQETFGEQMASRQAEQSAQLGRNRKIANAFRFICPSYYLPGKQFWGAF